jgi:hypothetical protein
MTNPRQRVGLAVCGTIGSKLLDRLRVRFPVPAFDLDEKRLDATTEARERGVRATKDRPRDREGIVRYWREFNG